MTASRAAIATAFLAVVVALVALSSVMGPENELSGAGQPHGETQPVLLAADDSGALVLKSDEVSGIRRDGQVAWKKRVDQVPLSSICQERCPRAILSGDGLGPLAVDSPPLVLGGARAPKGWAGSTGGKNEVLASDVDGAIRVVTDESGEARWEMTRPSGAVHREKAVGANVLWFPTSDGSAAVAMVLDAETSRYRQQPFVRRANGWHAVAQAAVNETGASGCIASRGLRWIVDGKTIQTRRGAQAVEVGGDFGNCAFTRHRLVMSGNSERDGAPQTEVVVLDQRGGVVWRRTFEAEVFVAASGRADEFMLMGDGSGIATLYDGGGKVLRTINHAAFASFTPKGDIVVVNSHGQVRWLER